MKDFEAKRIYERAIKSSLKESKDYGSELIKKGIKHLEQNYICDDMLECNTHFWTDLGLIVKDEDDNAYLIRSEKTGRVRATATEEDFNKITQKSSSGDKVYIFVWDDSHKVAGVYSYDEVEKAGSTAEESVDIHNELSKFRDKGEALAREAIELFGKDTCGVAASNVIYGMISGFSDELGYTSGSEWVKDLGSTIADMYHRRQNGYRMD